MENVYENCPEYGNDDYVLRMVNQRDKLDLLKVYSDKRAVPFFNSDNCGLLRLDIRSDYEISDEITKILGLIIKPAYSLFLCDKIATKAIASAAERIKALEELGFKLSEEKLTGHDGTKYDSYFVLEQQVE